MLCSESASIQVLSPRQALPRHRHPIPYIAVVLEGGYVEAGDAGRRSVQPGDMVLHRRFEAHANEVSRSGAKILNLRLATYAGTLTFAQLSDCDEIVRESQRDAQAASQLALQLATPLDCQIIDWPDQLAYDLRRNDRLSLEEWAGNHGLAPATVSRGFRRVFGVTPKRYRLEIRAHRALRRLASSNALLRDIAFDAGFADQAHMSRTVRAVSGQPPSAWQG
jgi:AraC-like DNA-binding protein